MLTTEQLQRVAGYDEQMRAEGKRIHLKTQDNQPYGSERRCCERCGIMIWGSAHGLTWTDNREAYAAAATACDKEPRYWPGGD